MEIIFECGKDDCHTVVVPGDAWKNPPAALSCAPPAAAPAPGPGGHPDSITVTKARIGCLDIQTTGNLTSMVAASCNGRRTCSFKAPTEAAYRAAGVKANTRFLCTQAMEITYNCGR